VALCCYAVRRLDLFVRERSVDSYHSSLLRMVGVGRNERGACLCLVLSASDGAQEDGLVSFLRDSHQKGIIPLEWV
jgi:hypothetical protein